MKNVIIRCLSCGFHFVTKTALNAWRCRRCEEPMTGTTVDGLMDTGCLMVWESEEIW